MGKKKRSVKIAPLAVESSEIGAFAQWEETPEVILSLQSNEHYTVNPGSETINTKKKLLTCMITAIK